MKTEAEAEKIGAEPLQKQDVQPVESTIPEAQPEEVNNLSLVNGDKTELMKAVGIPESDWVFVDYVITNEGGWDGVTQWNRQGSGAYGICQALPATKMSTAGADYMTNAYTQMKWCHQYALNRYGSWSYAAEFKKCVGWCTNLHTGWSGEKDHTWW